MKKINTDVWRLRSTSGRTCEVAAPSLHRAVEVAVAQHPAHPQATEQRSQFHADRLASVERVLTRVLVDADGVVENGAPCAYCAGGGPTDDELDVFVAAGRFVDFVREAHLDVGLEVHEDGDEGMGLSAWEVRNLLKQFTELAAAVDAASAREES